MSLPVFEEIPATQKSIDNRKLVYGVGINDADYQVNPTIDGSRVMCPAYSAWHSMIERCYSEKYHDKKPTYKECYVCDEWLYFLKFKSWMEKQDYKGKELDKDILIQGNKVYSPETRIFVDKTINVLF